MAQHRDRPSLDPEATRDLDATRPEADKPERLGDVLGVSDTPPDVDIPQATTNHGGHPAGIEVRQHATGTGELRRTAGATGIDMGAGGTGTDIDPASSKPTAARSDVNE
jgi:hypothetical protein